MIESMYTTLKRQLPEGLAWLLPTGYFKSLIEALAIEPKRVAAFLQGVQRESNPGTAIDTQEEWYGQYGIPYDGTGSLQSKQDTTLTRYISLGGQDIVYFQDKVTRSGFDAILIVENGPPDEADVCGEAVCGEAECERGSTVGVCGVARCGISRCISEDLTLAWIFYFYVRGTVNTISDFNRLAALVQFLSPAHTIPIYEVTRRGNVHGLAVCGVGVCSGI